MLDDCNIGTFDILGSSNAVSDFIPSRIGKGVVGFAFPGTTPIETYFIARRIVSCSVHPQAVLISIPIILFTTPKHDKYFWSYVSYGIIDYDSLEELRYQSRHFNDNLLFGSPTPYDLESRLKSILAASRFPSYTMDSLIENLHQPRKGRNKETYSKTLQSRGTFFWNIYRGCFVADSDAYLDDFDLDPMEDYYFDKTLQLFASHHIAVYNLSIPYNRDAWPHLNNNVLKAFHSYLERYTKRYPEFHVLGAAYPQLSYIYFGDSSHLNPWGAMLWSDFTRDLLNAAHAPGGPFIMENQAIR